MQFEQRPHPEAMATTQLENTMEITESQNNAQNAQQSYASTVARNLRPKKEQAIIIDSIEGYTNDDYIDGLEELINPAEVRFISKISGARVCIFLSSEKLVEELVLKKVKVKDSILSIRPYVEKNKRVVISNVNPTIPDEIILNAFKNKGIATVSNIHNLKASLIKPGRAHILSFRRHIYIKEQDEELLPATMEIFYEDTKHYIYLSTDSARCFICKQNGHIAKLCPNVSRENLAENSNVNNDRASDSPQVFTNLNNRISEQINTNPNRAQKRPPPPSSTTGSVSEAGSVKNTTHMLCEAEELPKKVIERKKAESFKTPASKKMCTDKGTNKLSTDDAIDEAVNAIQKTGTSFIITSTQLQEFINKSHGCTNVLALSHEYTKETDQLVDMLEKVHPYIAESHIKAKFTRIKKKLRKQTASDSQSQDSDSSCSKEID